MGIKRRSSLRKSSFVYKDENGKRVVKTPGTVILSWPEAFRAAYLNDYKYIGKDIARQTYAAVFQDHEGFTKKHRIRNRDYQFDLRWMQTPGGNNVRITGLYLKCYQSKQAIEISNPTPEMRSLIVYGFMQGKSIGGVPDPTDYDMDDNGNICY